MKRKAHLLCFIGIDGTGKTTLAQMLAEEMTKNGIKSNYVMGRFESFALLKPAMFVVKKMLSLLGKRTDQSAEGVRTKRRLFKNRFLAKIWQFSMLSDYFIQLGYKIRLPLMLGRSVFSDRYVYDTVVDLAADFALSVPRMKQSLEKLLSLAPKPDVVFLIDLPEALAYERNLGKHDNLSVDYLGKRRRLYLSFKGRPEVEVLDGSKEPESLLEIVADKIRATKVLE